MHTQTPNYLTRTGGSTIAETESRRMPSETDSIYRFLKEPMFALETSKSQNIAIRKEILLTSRRASFSYYEIYLSLLKILEKYELVHEAGTAISTPLAGLSSPDWQPVQLPKRKEWVAAVLTEPLLVEAVPRDLNAC